MNKALKMLDKICERYGYKIRGLYGNVSDKETEIVCYAKDGNKIIELNYDKDLKSWVEVERVIKKAL